MKERLENLQKEARKVSKITSIVFAVLAILEFCGYVFEGKKWCLYGALLIAAFSMIMYVDSKTFRL